MKIRIQKKVGNTVFVFDVEEAKYADALAKASQIATIPEKCVCGNTDVVLANNKGTDKRTGRAYTYIKVRCNKCGQSSTMGDYADGSGFFFKDFKKYQPKSVQESKEIDINDIDSIVK